MEDTYTYVCGHGFHRTCSEQWGLAKPCPLCRATARPEPPPRDAGTVLWQIFAILYLVFFIVDPTLAISTFSYGVRAMAFVLALARVDRLFERMENRQYNRQ